MKYRVRYVKKSKKKQREERLATVFIVVGLLVAMLISCSIETDENKKALKDYNNGTCVECCHDYDCYEFFDESSDMMVTAYKCSRCKHRGVIKSHLIED